MARYCTTILLGAFLLFQVQPQIARTILPWFGGGASVWSTCMLFFQVLLLGGYAYAHFLNRKLAPKTQAILHIALLGISLAFLPVLPAEHWKPTGTESPVLHILLLLLATVGMPYLLLSATGPLLQSWFAREYSGRSPYRLYSLSNVGSLAALLSFPFVFEPNLAIGVQAGFWSWSYAVFAALCGICAWTSTRPAPAGSKTTATSDHAERAEEGDLRPIGNPPVRDPTVSEPTPGTPEVHGSPVSSFGSDDGGTTVAPPPSRPITVEAPPAVAAAAAASTDTTTTAAPTTGRKLGWIALAALPSVMLLAVTNTICQDIAVIPFFWVMPLSLYLVTFILTFESERWYRPAVLAPTLGLSALAVFLIPPSWFMDSVTPQILLLCGSLFVCGMVCHGELVRNKPDPKYLTGFYLFVSFGGALGGLFVAVIAPLVFDTFLETEVALAGCVAAAIYAGFRHTSRDGSAGEKTGKMLRIALPFTLGIGVFVGFVLRSQDDQEYLERSRNFFGTLSVKAEVGMVQVDGQFTSRKSLCLTHGSTVHGRQVIGAGVEPGEGMTYYWPGSGVAHALENHPARANRAMRVGVVGLGTGTLAHYSRKGDSYTYYEIDPNIEHVAESHFSYMSDARARGASVVTHLGDARIQLERELADRDGHGFDVLVVDAFNSDSIPVHLLTRECNAVYWQHLKSDGILMVHVSNRHLDLTMVVRGLAEDAGKEFRIIHAQPENIRGANTSDWIIVTSNAAYLGRKELQATRSDSPKSQGSANAKTLLWTDDFSSLWHVLR